MKKNTLLLLFLATCFLANAQETRHWTVKSNKLQLLNTDTEDTAKNIIPVRISDLSSKNIFTVSYFTEKTGNKDSWKRTIGIYSMADKELYRKDAPVLKINGAALKKMLLENKIIKIYSWAIPKDPAQAARVRVRRVHLCSIELI